MHDQTPSANCAVYINAANMARFKHGFGTLSTADGKTQLRCAVVTSTAPRAEYVEITVSQRDALGVKPGDHVFLRRCTPDDGVASVADAVVLTVAPCNRSSGFVLTSEMESVFKWSYHGCVLNVGQILSCRIKSFYVNATVAEINGGRGRLMDATTTTVTCTSSNPKQLRIVDVLPEMPEEVECTIKLFYCYLQSAQKDAPVGMFRITTDGMDACRKALSEKHGTLERLRLVSEADYDDLAGDGPRAMNELRAVLCCFLEKIDDDGFDLGVYNPIEYKSVVTAFNLYCTSSVHCTLRVKGADNKA